MLTTNYFTYTRDALIVWLPAGIHLFINLRLIFFYNCDMHIFTHE